jgi:hypothetical protein
MTGGGGRVPLLEGHLGSLPTDARGERVLPLVLGIGAGQAVVAGAVTGDDRCERSAGRCRAGRGRVSVVVVGRGICPAHRR